MDWQVRLCLFTRTHVVGLQSVGRSVDLSPLHQTRAKLSRGPSR